MYIPLSVSVPFDASCKNHLTDGVHFSQPTSVLSGFKEPIWERPVEKERPQPAKAEKQKEEPVQENKPVAPTPEPAQKSQDKPSGKTTKPKETPVNKPVDKAPKPQEKPLSSKPAKSKKSDLDFINNLAAALKL